MWLLLGAARTRAAGRKKRQQELLAQRTGKQSSTNWSGFGSFFAILLMAAVNIAAAFLMDAGVKAAQRVEVERQGKIVVGNSFYTSVEAILGHLQIGHYSKSNDKELAQLCSREAKRIVDEYGGSQAEIERKIHLAVRDHGSRDLVLERDAVPGISALARTGRYPALIGSMLFLWWALMLVFQGEGVELDTQRRRHPMWEWLFTHPVPAGGVFLAEMISPIAANPVYWCAPLCVGFLYGFVHGPIPGFLAAVLIGLPLTVAAACMGKALEIAVTLRFPPRSRGAIIGLMGWLGYVSFISMLFGITFLPRLVVVSARLLEPFTVLPWPWLGLFLGLRSDGSLSFAAGLIASWMVAGLTLAASVWFGVWGAKQGLGGNPGRADTVVPRSKSSRPGFGKDPLYRKEFLWFARDRSAIVQAILVPLTVAAFQLFNFRGLLNKAQGEWNYLCGAAILFGTYFLWILGPRSLSSEGTALWIALTWPRGMESLLKAKAWLWSLISTGLVALVLCYAIYLYPAHLWHVLLVGVGWFLFGRSMAEKTVTLVSVTSSSGEPERIPTGRRWAAQLGMLTFSIGVITQQWHLAIVGIVYSYLTAAAMWQNFRARLPFLYDPWSEELPPPPTLMHAMIAISLLIEGGAVVTAFVAAFGGREGLPVALTVGYAISAIAVWLGMSFFLSERNVLPRDVWQWRAPGAEPENSEPWRARMAKLLPLLVLGAAGGVALGLFARGYKAVLQMVPATQELIRSSQQQMDQMPELKIALIVMAVAFAPFAEEYLFRGLLFRALDREWGGWAAVLGSAAFFAIYHPALSWLPVGMLGATNALLFKKTGRLAPAIALHMVYNAVVLIGT